MGVHKNITATTFPKQGKWVGKRVRVQFHYGPDELIGKFIRVDMESPYATIIQLDDGRVVLGEECQYSGPLEEKNDET
jgi:hypothetical protein